MTNNAIAWQRVLTKALQVRAWMQTREQLLTVLTITKEKLKVFTYKGEMFNHRSWTIFYYVLPQIYDSLG